jgi:hypothetical protein
MRGADFNTGTSRLKDAFLKLQVQWELAQSQWHDPVSMEFERKYMEPLEAEVLSTLQKMGQLGQVVISAQHECRQDSE